MKGHINTYRKLSEIVNDALDDVQGGMHWQFRFQRWGMKYAEELHFDHSRDVRTIAVNFKPWKAIELPEDCVDWVLVGIQNGEDVMTYTKDDNIAQLFDQDDTNNNQLLPNLEPTYSSEENLAESPAFMSPFLNLTPSGEDAGRLFGLRCKYNGLGYFTDNKNKDVSEIQFSGPDVDLTQKVYLTYISNLWSPTEESLIHPFHAEYIVAGIRKEYEAARLSAGSGNVGSCDLASAEFDRQYWKVIDRAWDLRVEDIYEYFKARYQLTPRIP